MSTPELAPEGRRMLRLEARNAETPIERKPPWIKTRVRTGPEYTALQHLVKSEGLHTVCQEAGCPNIFECWEDREATFLIGGDQCTQAVRLLPDRHRQAAAARPRRAAPRRRVRRRHGAALRDRHRGRPRRPARRRVLAVRADRQGDPRRRARLRGRTARPRLQRRPRAARRGVQRRGPRCSRTTWRRCRGSSSGSGPASATSARSTCSARRTRPAWSPSPT